MTEKSDSKIFSTLAIVFGAVSVIFLPIVFGPAAIVLAVIGIVKKERLAPVGLAVGILGMIVGLFLGAVFAAAMFGI